MKKTNASSLNLLLTEELKHKPHFFSSPLWTEIKKALTEVRPIMVDTILEKHDIFLIEFMVSQQLEYISEAFNANELLEAHRYIVELLEYYMKLSTSIEEYESSANLLNLLNIMSVKVKVKK